MLCSVMFIVNSLDLVLELVWVGDVPVITCETMSDSQAQPVDYLSAFPGLYVCVGLSYND